MVALIIGMLICVGLALAVVALVAIPARRDGRDILSPKGEEVVTALKERQQSARQRLERGDRDDTATDSDTSDDARGVEDAAVVSAGSADTGARS